MGIVQYAISINNTNTHNPSKPFFAAAGLGDIRNDNDANLTYEGENHVLIQQTSSWLLKLWPLILKRQQIVTPMASANFLSDGLTILRNYRFTATTFDEMSFPQSKYVTAIPC